MKDSSRILIPSSKLTMPQYIEGVAKGWVFRHIKAPEGTVWVKVLLVSASKDGDDWVFEHNNETVFSEDWSYSVSKNWQPILVSKNWQPTK